MNKELRQAIIAGNWKMNKTRPEAKALIEELKPIAEKATCGVVICVPFTNLETAVELTKGTNIKVGAENVHFEKSGAFTGEISADMLTEIGVEYVIIGHSERRQYFGETDETVNKRTKSALAAGLKPIVCVGELLWERECGITEEVVARQIKLDFFNVSAEDVTIQYGGSMNPKNAAELVAQPDVDGGLIGGASLKAADFGVLLEAASNG